MLRENEGKRMKDKRALAVGLPLAYLYSFLLVMGRAYQKAERHPLVVGWNYLWIFLLGIIAYPLIIGVWKWVIKRNSTMDLMRRKARLSRKYKIGVFIVIFLAWIPCWLAAYPGFFCYDATQEFNTVYNGTFSAHHPILHSMLLTYPMMLSEKLFGTFNSGIALYCLLQMLLGAGVFTYVICFLHRYVERTWVTIMAVLYYMFSPVIVLFSSCTTKDVMSGLLVIVFILRYYELYLQESTEERDGSIFSKVFFAVIIVLMLFLRKNVAIAMVVFLLSQFCYQRQWKKRMFILLIGLVIYYLCNSVLMKGLKAVDSPISEALSIPAQQIAAVYTYEGGKDAFSEEQWDMLCKIFVEEELEGNYCPWVSDPIKQRIEDEYVSVHFIDFLRLWTQLLLEYPEHYFNAFFYMTYQAWYPFTDMTGYNNTWYTYQEFETCFFACTVEAPGTLESVLPELFERIRTFSLMESIWKTPVVGMLCSVGFQLWLLLFAIGYSIYTKQKGWLVLQIFPCCLIFTNFMGPMVLVRYYLFLFYLLPIIVGTMMVRIKSEVYTKDEEGL